MGTMIQGIDGRLYSDDFLNDLRELNEVLFTTVRSALQRSPFADCRATVRDYIRQYENLESRHGFSTSNASGLTMKNANVVRPGISNSGLQARVIFEEETSPMTTKREIDRSDETDASGSTKRRAVGSSALGPVQELSSDSDVTSAQLTAQPTPIPHLQRATGMTSLLGPIRATQSSVDNGKIPLPNGKLTEHVEISAKLKPEVPESLLATTTSSASASSTSPFTFTAQPMQDKPSMTTSVLGVQPLVPLTQFKVPGTGGLGVAVSSSPFTAPFHFVAPSSSAPSAVPLFTSTPGAAVSAPSITPFQFKPFAPPSGTSSGGLFGGVASSSVLQQAAAANNNEDDGRDDSGDEAAPPEAEVVDVKEPGAFYSKPCQLLYRLPVGNKELKEKGAGVLFLKKTEGNGKTQLIVRAQNALRSVLLNVLLTEKLPLSQQGRQSVRLVCAPNPPLLEKVVVAEFFFKCDTPTDAQELFTKLDKEKQAAESSPSGNVENGPSANQK